MCGRFVRITSIGAIKVKFKVDQIFSNLAPSYNIAPSQEIVIINDVGVRQLIQCKWGFIPSWAKDPFIGHTMINARSETVARKPAFRSSFKKKRCLVIADGFYEWRVEGKKKFPMYIRLTSGECFGFAGLYNIWTSPDGKQLCTCTIITTEANETVRPIHDRMPVILPRDKEDTWLDPAFEDKEQLLAMLKPYPAEAMVAHEVSTEVNNPSYNCAESIKPVQ
jgi:putative SOS response-associated peptidase YedK